MVGLPTPPKLARERFQASPGTSEASQSSPRALLGQPRSIPGLSWAAKSLGSRRGYRLTFFRLFEGCPERNDRFQEHYWKLPGWLLGWRSRLCIGFYDTKARDRASGAGKTRVNVTKYCKIHLNAQKSTHFRIQQVQRIFRIFRILSADCLSAPPFHARRGSG